jgi:two-component system, OmpR family, phosphate regulon sensor histidine kinase PhoR
MTRKTFRWVVLLAGVSIVGMAVLQAYWFGRAFHLQEDRFHRDVHLALTEVAHQFFEWNNLPIPHQPVVHQLASNYFVVRVNHELDTQVLEVLLTSALWKRQIPGKVEYGVYNCSDDRMVYGSVLPAMDGKPLHAAKANLPQWQGQDYYFGVYLPHQSFHLLNELSVWIFSSGVLLLVTVFFVYTLWVIFRQRRLAEVQRDFINNMAHEFKTPIASLTLAADSIQNSTDPAQLTAYTQIIAKEAWRLHHHVERVLEIAKTEEILPEANREPVRVAPLLESAILQAGLSREQVSLTGIKEDMRVLADSLHLRNALANLFENARKYGGDQVTLTLEGQKQGNRLLMEMEDNGPGIPKSERQRVFMKFYRIPTGLRHNVKGFGLGLFYVRQVIKAHGGTIKAVAPRHTGARFIIEIPILHD